MRKNLRDLCVEIPKDLLHLVFLFEAIDTSGCIHESLVAGVVGMAVGADLNVHIPTGRAGIVVGATGTGDRCGLIFWMDIRFHCYSLPFGPGR